MEDYFFPQTDWILDAIHTKIFPLVGHKVKNDFSVEEKIKRSRLGV
ncbi:MAG: hypothetical protein KAT38_00700 [Bacteroidales bacterium]|nr:hypothetical protein [Bacteroidales bacterium]